MLYACLPLRQYFKASFPVLLNALTIERCGTPWWPNWCCTSLCCWESLAPVWLRNQMLRCLDHFWGKIQLKKSFGMVDWLPRWFSFMDKLAPMERVRAASIWPWSTTLETLQCKTKQKLLITTSKLVMAACRWLAITLVFCLLKGMASTKITLLLQITSTNLVYWKKSLGVKINRLRSIYKSKSGEEI